MQNAYMFASFLVLASRVGPSYQQVPVPSPFPPPDPNGPDPPEEYQQYQPPLDSDAEEVFDYWTNERVANAVPRDMFNEEDDQGGLARNLRSRNLLVGNAAWPQAPAGGKVADAAGRLFFSKGSKDYVCTATVIDDMGTAGRSLILTAAHCLCDDGIWFKNFLFIPDQDDGPFPGNYPGEKSNRFCFDDPYGCWAPQVPLVETRWTTVAWPNSIPFDYGVLVVSDTGRHKIGYLNFFNHALDVAVPNMNVELLLSPIPQTDAYLLGYPWSQDPDFRYCMDKLVLKFKGADPYWELPGCMLSGGASGGPGLRDATGNGNIFTVISYGYKNGAGNGGPFLNGYFPCVYTAAKMVPLGALPGRVVFGDDCRLRDKPRVFGDPHFQTWSGKRYDYMGSCDLVLMKAPNFDPAKNLTMDAIVRTKNRYDYSYAQSIILKIGENYLQVSSFGDYSLDGVSNAEMPNELAGFNVTHSHPSPHVHKFNIELGIDDKIEISSFKDMVSIKVDDTLDRRFHGSLGLLGNFDSGKMLKRDGVTELSEDDPNAFADEWQVRDDEPMLFGEADYPQYPQKCVLPDPKKRLHTKGNISREKAERACADWDDNAKEDCIVDVIATGDFDLAAAVDH